jgi:predicted O-linked N-acetylglucosamine transferase (SPINDLY family)
LTLDQQLALGLSHHQAGRLGDAERIYREILSRHPNHADATHLLGVLAAQAGRLDVAEECFRRAIQIKPDFAEAYGNLGNVLTGKGQLDEAVNSYQHAIRLKPDFVQAYNNLGNALSGKGQFEEAIASFRQAIVLRPDYAPAHDSLGNVLKQIGRLDEAIDSYRQAVKLWPDFAEAHSNLGNALTEAGLLSEAIDSFRRAIQLKPNFSEAHNNLGVALLGAGKADEAVASHRHAIRLRPDDARAHSNLGNALQSMGRHDEAIASYRHAIQLKPDYVEAHSNLGNALQTKGQLDEAVATCRRAVELQPAYADTHNNLGNALKSLGLIEEAIASYCEAIRLNPKLAEAHSNLVFALQYLAGSDARMIYEEHHRWNQQHAQPLGKFIKPHTNNRDPARRLRVGYVSSDLRIHPVSRFLLPLFSHLDRDAFEIICYSNFSHADAMTDRLSAHANEWHNIVGHTDQGVAEKIREDRIDILVDLSGHTAGNRLGVFARKPAPVQIAYLGYPGTTGLTEMDYRFTDPFADPPGTTELLHSEKLWRLPACNWCSSEPDDAPAVRQLRTDGPICFGTFNNIAKASPTIMELWATILAASPSSRLMIKSPGMGEQSDRRRIKEFFMSRGIQEDRLQIRGHEPDMRSHLELYNQLDIALDTFPYHGTTTTCEALWMGVPVITLAGQTHVSRVGVSLLSNVGLPELIAQSAEEYVSIAIGMAGNLPRLAELRQTLRSRMQASPLMDAPRFARNVEAAYREMWRNWCAEGAT